MLSSTALDRHLVEEVMGRLDDLKLAEILASGASPAELQEAKRWSVGEKRTVPDALRLSVVDRLCDILRMDDPDWDERA